MKKKGFIKQLFIFGGVCTLTAAAIIVPKMNKALPLPLLPTTSQTESAFQYTDPYGVLKNVSTDNKERILVVDMRSPGDYKERRFKNTVNIYFPYEKDREQEKAFVKAVGKEAANYKQVVLLPYSGMSTTGEDAATLLIESGVDNVAVMKAGWNELYSLPNMWVPEEKVGEIDLTKLLEH